MSVLIRRAAAALEEGQVDGLAFTGRRRFGVSETNCVRVLSRGFLLDNCFLTLLEARVRGMPYKTALEAL